MCGLFSWRPAFGFEKKIFLKEKGKKESAFKGRCG
jgi:hypothetical protein